MADPQRAGGRVDEHRAHGEQDDRGGQGLVADHREGLADEDRHGDEERAVAGQADVVQAVEHVAHDEQSEDGDQLEEHAGEEQDRRAEVAEAPGANISMYASMSWDGGFGTSWPWLSRYQPCRPLADPAATRIEIVRHSIAISRAHLHESTACSRC